MLDSLSLRRLLERVRAGDASIDQAMETLGSGSFTHIEGLATLDTERELRSGLPEVVFGASKSAPQILEILEHLASAPRGALATRVSPEKAREILTRVPGDYDALTQTLVTPHLRPPCFDQAIAIVSAGTSDLPVAGEADRTARFLGFRTECFVDVGIASIQRILQHVPTLRKFRVVIVLAGMEGALPAVVAGLVPAPVIAVPTSVGYGVGLGGFVALQSMLTACSPGVLVVNIDNGFGAAAAAAKILQPHAYEPGDAPSS